MIRRASRRGKKALTSRGSKGFSRHWSPPSFADTAVITTLGCPDLWFTALCSPDLRFTTMPSAITRFRAVVLIFVVLRQVTLKEDVGLPVFRNFGVDMSLLIMRRGVDVDSMGCPDHGFATMVLAIMRFRAVVHGFV